MTHEIYLKQALQLAEIRRGFCAPNPSVGAVVVKNNKVISTGFHFASGAPHAEVDALNKCGDEARGATIYVTLEPCCHWGKTPPCTQLLIDRGIKTVIYGLSDPNPLVAGKGHANLEAANISCEQYTVPEISAFYASYYYWHKTGLPWVTAKITTLHSSTT
jgi:diaminohydroxyphosphoribosylaminopyrimidine deaminase/5-amino-6-(5-phosphoribosylamino)uracil reductase